MQVDVNTRSKTFELVIADLTLAPIFAVILASRSALQNVMTHAQTTHDPKTSVSEDQATWWMDTNRSSLGEKGEEERRKRRKKMCLLTFNGVAPLL